MALTKAAKHKSRPVLYPEGDNHPPSSIPKCPTCTVSADCEMLQLS